MILRSLTTNFEEHFLFSNRLVQFLIGLRPHQNSNNHFFLFSTVTVYVLPGILHQVICFYLWSILYIYISFFFVIIYIFLIILLLINVLLSMKTNYWYNSYIIQCVFIYIYIFINVSQLQFYQLLTTDTKLESTMRVLQQMFTATCILCTYSATSFKFVAVCNIFIIYYTDRSPYKMEIFFNMKS